MASMRVEDEIEDDLLQLHAVALHQRHVVGEIGAQRDIVLHISLSIRLTVARMMSLIGQPVFAAAASSW